jgi:cytolysin (calcineurin-like family phosphatase)
MNKEILEITKNFHDTYEKLASEYAYKTREDTKVFNINSNNGKLMYATINEIVSPILKENQELKKQLHDASIQIQELIEKDIWCPSNCEKLEKLEQENKQLHEELEWAIGIVEHNRIIGEKNKEIHQLKEKLDCDLQWALKYEKQVGNWNKLKEWLKLK